MKKVLLLSIAVLYSMSTYSMSELLEDNAEYNVHGTVQFSQSYVLAANSVIHNHGALTVADDINGTPIPVMLSAKSDVPEVNRPTIIHYDGFDKVASEALEAVKTRYGAGANTYTQARIREIPIMSSQINLTNIKEEMAISKILDDYKTLQPEDQGTTLYDLTTIDTTGGDNKLEGDENGQNDIYIENDGTLEDFPCNLGCKLLEDNSTEGREVININFKSGKYNVTGNNSLYSDGVVNIAAGLTINVTNPLGLYQSNITAEAPADGSSVSAAVITLNASGATAEEKKTFNFPAGKTLDASKAKLTVASNNILNIEKGAIVKL